MPPKGAARVALMYERPVPACSSVLLLLIASSEVLIEALRYSLTEWRLGSNIRVLRDVFRLVSCAAMARFHVSECVCLGVSAPRTPPPPNTLEAQSLSLARPRLPHTQVLAMSFFSFPALSPLLGCHVCRGYK